MKTAFCILSLQEARLSQHSAFRRGVLVFALSALFLVPAFAQEAFYIYRNDGDFNGFFYDEVIEMRQSKIGVDSIEYDRWVTQEVVLADTIYRIPLAAIDSIGFQQPEIKFNPRVKFMEKEGLCPYYLGCGNTDSEFIFENLPAHLVPQVGDVLIGLPTDSISDKYYDWDYFGSFSCVVEEVRPGEPWQGENLTIVYGHPVDKPSDVFEQYITVEEIGVDENNQILRRVAGCTPDGLPRKMKDGDTGDIKWFNFNGKITHAWNPSENSSIDLSADVSLVFRLRIAYEITWTKVFVKLTKDMNFSIQPSIGVAANYEWVGSPGKFLWMPELLAPAPCPILRVNPLPDVFLKVSGSIEGRFNLPKVQLGFGDELIINSSAWFPISYTIHPLPDKDKEADANIFDLSGGLKMSGALQMGIEFQAIIGTASWIKKIINADIGLHLWTGPKLSGEISYDSKVNAETHDYWMLSNGHVDLSLLALDLEAGATAGIGWSDPEEIKFYEKSWDFMTTKVRLAPRFKQTEARVEPKNIVVTIHPEQDFQLLTRNIKIGLFDIIPGDSGDSIPLLPITTTGNWDINQAFLDEQYEGRFPVTGLKARRYMVCPIVDCGTFGEYHLRDVDTYAIPDVTLSLQNNNIHFNAAGTNKPYIAFTSNVAFENLRGIEGDYYRTKYFIDSCWVDTIDANAEKYKMVFRGVPNDRLWALPPLQINDSAASIFVGKEGGEYLSAPFGISQENGPLNNMKVTASRYLAEIAYSGDVTATRQGDDVIIITGTNVEVSKGGDNLTYSETQTINLTLTNAQPSEIFVDSIAQHERYYVTGTITTRSTINGHFYGSKNWTISGSGTDNKIVTTITSSSRTTRNYPTVFDGDVFSYDFNGEYTDWHDESCKGDRVEIILSWDYVDNLPE